MMMSNGDTDRRMLQEFRQALVAFCPGCETWNVLAVAADRAAIDVALFDQAVENHPDEVECQCGLRALIMELPNRKEPALDDECARHYVLWAVATEIPRRYRSDKHIVREGDDGN